ncbi:MAG: DUF2892 domain-containing protein [Calditrichaeota bacterium]|nr:DUF2892 domain-containing protein [Calditrichota bacterium]
MKANEGTTDRIIRVIIGIILIVVGFFVVKATLGIVLGIIGIVLLLTGAVGFCALYPCLKINTAQKKE